MAKVLKVLFGTILSLLNIFILCFYFYNLVILDVNLIYCFVVLARYHPDLWGISVCTIDGQRFSLVYIFFILFTLFLEIKKCKVIALKKI